VRRQGLLPVLAVIAIAMTARPARATTFELEALSWQARTAPGAAAKSAPIQTLALAKNEKVAGRLSAKLNFLNRGPAVEGVLIRYSLEGKIAPAGHPDQAAWAVPFLVDEKRVPKVNANSHVETTLLVGDPDAQIDIYLKNIAYDGYAVQALRLRVMISPRRGQEAPIQVLDSELPIEVKP